MCNMGDPIGLPSLSLFGTLRLLCEEDSVSLLEDERAYRAEAGASAKVPETKQPAREREAILDHPVSAKPPADHRDSPHWPRLELPS